MKPIELHPALSVLILSTASLLIMLLVDRMLGPRAEYLNAWSIGCQWIRTDPGIPPCTIQANYGLFRATMATLLVNGEFGLVLFALLKWFRVLG